MDATLEVVKTLDECVSAYAQATLEGCAYAGTGDVLRVQALLAVCGQHPKEEAEAAEGGAVPAAVPADGAAPAAGAAATGSPRT